MKRLAGLLSMAALVFTVACGETDAGITTSVKTALAADETVSAYEIDVDTRERVVTLSGAVDTPAAKQQAVAVARQTDGVADVIDNLIVSDAVATSGEAIGDRTESGIREGADATGNAIDRAGDAAERGADAAAEGAREAGRDVRDAVTGDGR